MKNKTPAQLLAASKTVKPSRPIKPNASRASPWNCSLRRLRDELGLSLDDVANAVGMSKAGYWEIEKGGDPMLSTAHKLAKFFGKATCDIWRRRDTNQPECSPILRLTEK